MACELTLRPAIAAPPVLNGTIRQGREEKNPIVSSRNEAISADLF